MVTLFHPVVLFKFWSVGYASDWTAGPCPVPAWPAGGPVGHVSDSAEPETWVLRSPVYTGITTVPARRLNPGGDGHVGLSAGIIIGVTCPGPERSRRPRGRCSRESRGHSVGEALGPGLQRLRHISKELGADIIASRGLKAGPFKFPHYEHILCPCP